MAAKSFTRFLPVIARILLGLLFVVTGLNGFLNFLPQPKTPMSEAAMALAGALLKSGYLFKLIFATQLVGGLLLLAGRFVPLALAVLAPVVVNIVAFHLFLEPSGLPLAAVVLVLELYLAWAYRGAFRSMLAARVTPGS
ncbi:MAG TPA: DoxX family membrane protein [Alphaproteobacteria bacterium]|nr:DoxX family membrane protein [Alphaproteobacteria bacterium]